MSASKAVSIFYCAGATALTLLLLAAGCEKKPAPPVAPPVVFVTTVNPKDVPIYSQWIGTLEGNVNADIRAQVTGYLISQDYAEGSIVKEGELMFKIDPRPFQATLDQAKGNLAQDEARAAEAKLDVERYTPLAKVDAVSQQLYTSAVQSNLVAQAAVKSAQAAVENAQVNLGFTKITSPIDGLAGIAQAQIGNLVGPTSSTPLTTVSSINPIRVFFPVSEQQYLAYRRQYTNAAERAAHEREVELRLILSDGTEYPYPGKFLFAGREVNVSTGTLQLAGLFPNPNYTLRPGQYALVRARTQIRTNTIIVPQRAVSELQSSYQVNTVDAKNKAHIQTVTVGPQVGSDWIIEKGLKPGDRVVVEGLQKAKDGVEVKPEPWTPPAQTNNSVAQSTDTQ